MTDHAERAREQRFFIDHGVIHDRVTGKHVRSTPRDGNDGPSWEDGIEECCALLNQLADRAATSEAALREAAAEGAEKVLSMLREQRVPLTGWAHAQCIEREISRLAHHESPAPTTKDGRCRQCEAMVAHGFEPLRGCTGKEPAPTTPTDERGVVEFRCRVCARRTTSSTIWKRNADAYDGGEHCGRPMERVGWLANEQPGEGGVCGECGHPPATDEDEGDHNTGECGCTKARRLCWKRWGNGCTGRRGEGEDRRTSDTRTVGEGR